MPTSVVKTIADEQDWRESKAIAAKQGKSKSWGLIMHIFKNKKQHRKEAAVTSAKVIRAGKLIRQLKIQSPGKTIMPPLERIIKNRGLKKTAFLKGRGEEMTYEEKLLESFLQGFTEEFYNEVVKEAKSMKTLGKALIRVKGSARRLDPLVENISQGTKATEANLRVLKARGVNPAAKKIKRVIDKPSKRWVINQ